MRRWHFSARFVDATDLKVTAGTPFIVVRFTVPAASEMDEDRHHVWPRAACGRPLSASPSPGSTGYSGAVVETRSGSTDRRSGCAGDRFPRP